MRCSVIACYLGFAMLLGCSPDPTVRDSSRVLIQPGRGVTNLLEIGMTLQAVRDATHDVSTHGIYDRDWFWKRWGTSRCALIQSLGAVAPVEPGGKIGIICFHVVPYDSDVTMRGLTVTNPFRGLVGDKLSFDKGSVSRVEVEAQFGTVDRVVTNLADGLPVAQANQPFLYRAVDGGEKLYYRHKGIDFDLKSNVVTGVWIYEPSKASSATLAD